ncbi:hypothetical protein F2Q70_00031778 [Brassica cretica]|uniref:BnaA08g03270D protein n=4 Tax=Brassica TaxID=3705 RepID=A0A078CJP8_BRANA|nr:hypothetical protein F2Q70_00031778 [Brassica cretica]KAF3594651.1 hypothetical protein DY000_02025112 [Brassica cretica]CDY41832.1 BnaA08g03270D [Brassica napus]VDD38342.1 unnamed protein product [Brassica oleracea]
MNLTDFSMGFGSVFSLSGIHQVELFKHPHVLLLQYRNSIFKLPSGRLRLGESSFTFTLTVTSLSVLKSQLLKSGFFLDIEGLKRKLASKLLVNENVLVPGWR